MDISLGEVVKSKAGRDKGRYFIVRENAGEEYVLIVDGDLRKLEKPKKKKIKHLEGTGDVIEELIPSNQKNGRKLTNANFRKALSGYLSSRGIG